MNEIKIYLNPSGSMAELYKDFNLYQGSYRNTQINIYVPTEILYKNVDDTFLNTVQTGAIMTAPNGAKVTTLSYNAAFVKTVMRGNVEYAEYTQVMPKEFALYAGTQIIICNVMNIDNTNPSAPKIIAVTTTQRAPLVVLESAYLSDDEPLDPSQLDILEGQVNDLYTFRDNMETAVEVAQTSADSAAQSSETATNSAEAAQQSALNAENSAQRVESAAEYLEGVQNGEISVPKAISDGNGENISDQFKTVNSDIQGLREDITNESHFRGMFNSVEALRAAYPTATPNDYAYIVGGNIYIYQDDEWTDSGKPSPNTAVPASDATPLMAGTASAGTTSQYARGDHRHPSDTQKADIDGDFPNMSVGKLSTPHTIGGVSFDGSSDINHYATCTTAAATINKVVTKADFKLDAGARITVKFTYANTAEGATLNVNGTGYKPIKADGDTRYVKWLAGSIMDFVYDGAYWECVGGYQLVGKRVGYVYISNESTSPATLYGGSWTAITNRFLIGASTTYPVNSIGGASSHNHSLGTPSNSEAMALIQWNSESGDPVINMLEGNYSDGWTPVTQLVVTTARSYPTTVTRGAGARVVGSSQTTATLPPYQAVYMWYRTA